MYNSSKTPRKVSQNLILWQVKHSRRKINFLTILDIFPFSAPRVLFSIHWIAAMRKLLFPFLQLMIKIVSTKKISEDPSWKIKGRKRSIPPFIFPQVKDFFEDFWWTNHNYLIYSTSFSGENCRIYFFHSKAAELVFHLSYLLGTFKCICVLVSLAGEPRRF